MKKTKKITVSGRVQGVGFRYFVLRHARALDIKGYAKNKIDGSVEIVAQSDSLKHITKLKEKVEHGPALAKVRNVNTQDLDTKKEYRNFEIKY